jgi:small nuclear ribonucleoprotein (snRNP)-like protein
VVYTLVKKDNIMNIIVDSIREDGESYKKAQKRKDKYGKSLFEDLF